MLLKISESRRCRKLCHKQGNREARVNARKKFPAEKYISMP